MNSDFWEICGHTVHNREILGKGSFGIVYKATCPNGKAIAAKEVSYDKHREKCIKEATNYYKLPRDHANIVHIYDVKRHPDKLRKEMWIFMEYCIHGDLDVFFKENFEVAQEINLKCDLMAQITRGIEYLHQHDIVHRDIKPANTLVTNGEKPGKYVVKLTDFGLSKYLDPTGETSAMSSDVGTLLFKAPEYFVPRQHMRLRYHRSVDIYAAGLTFLAMLEAKEGKRLRPPTCPYHNNCIGLTLYIKKTTGEPQCNVIPSLDYEENDDDVTKMVKDIARSMTHVQAEKRPSATQVLRQLVSNP